MAVLVRLTNPSQVLNRSPKPNVAGSIHMSRDIYQKLGSLVKNKTLVAQYDSGSLTNEYSRVLDELNNLFLKMNYPKLHGNLVIADGIVELDEYLGSLGIDDNYRYSKDFVNIPQWMESEDPAEMRVLFDFSDDTYLVDGDEVLVIYK